MIFLWPHSPFLQDKNYITCSTKPLSKNFESCLNNTHTQKCVNDKDKDVLKISWHCDQIHNINELTGKASVSVLETFKRQSCILKLLVINMLSSESCHILIYQYNTTTNFNRSVSCL